MPMIIHISHRQVPYVFIFDPHHSNDPSMRSLENDFYENFGKMPEGSHIELEIAHPGPDSALWNMNKNFHIHKGKDGMPYVCWPFPMPNREEAERVARIWSVGTVYTVLSGRSFTEIFSKDQANFTSFMEQEHGIVVLNVLHM